MAHSRNSKTRIKAARRGIEALRLREAGLNYKEIGTKMKVSEQRAWYLVSKEFDRLNEKRSEKATSALRLELSRLDAMFKATYARAKAGDLKAIGAALKIVETRAGLLGLNTIKHEVKVSNEHQINVSARIDEYTAELKRQLEARPREIQCDPAGDSGGESLDQASTDDYPIPVS